ncbi:hypothetical protein HII36_51360 [Nonomuraea sp. NN258]|uniref:matrixin family metalloprotease n=1 Tax=Nonomuraea antri TaxID=2730852 RepID=UPI0015684ECD|nr:matrixin family metalloprotease [Nonomuraea antri]NRQ40170.1 hypothetical protein [Nonomuraea antri]
MTDAEYGPAGPLPDPGDKARSPLTDLAAYPKLTSGQLAAKVAAESVARESADQRESAPFMELTDTSTLPDGRVRVTHFTFIPGTDATKAVKSLRERGFKNVKQEQPEAKPNASDSGIGAFGPNDCALGQARSVTCPNSWWSNLGRNNPVVLFNDHSSAAWPTTNAVYKWNQTPNIDSWYTWNNCNPSNVHCVDVWSGNYGDTGGLIGETVHYYIPPNHGRIIDAVVRLNDWYQPDTWTRNAMVTHELGHVLGLGHNQWSGDVMHQYVGTREDIGGENPALLAQIYSIDRQ